MAQLQDVNTTDLKEAMRLGCRTMSSVFDADDEHGVPYFGSVVLPEARLSFSSGTSESHVPGRHLNAMLAAEAAAGIELDEDAVEQHAKAALFSYSGPACLPLNRQEREGPLLNFHSHNIREGFHALYPLIRYRGCERALDVAKESIRTIQDLWKPEGWNIERIKSEFGLEAHVPESFITGVARCIGPLVKLYRATSLSSALELALALKEKAVNEVYLEAGDYDEGRFGSHTHSTTCVMSSLAQLADLTGDASLMNRVRAFYDNGLWEIRDELGWVIESSRAEAQPDRGEVNNTGDIVETALLLGKWGFRQYYQDAERILRGHLLPSQLRDVSFIDEPDNPDSIDGLTNVADRHLGAFGFPAPYGHSPVDATRISFNMDIVGGAVASAAEAHLDAVRADETGVHVNLFFDNETDDAAVESPYTHENLRIRLKKPAALWVRLPCWVDAAQIRIGGSDRPVVANGALYFASPPVNRWLTFSFDLPEEVITLKHRTRDIRVRLRGDSVVAMDNFGTDHTFFEPFD
ncbi:MAG: hypothetical protein QF437_07065 [Planctomycetota bacterium]|nr:hypothetical protein [Planctomycetota bacterium]